MYTFLRMGVNDFKNRMKMYEYCIYFSIGLDFSATFHFGRSDLGVHRDFKIHNHFTEQSDC